MRSRSPSPRTGNGAFTGRPWRRTVDTALPSPGDALGLDEGPVIPIMYSYQVEARSMVILASEAGGG